MDIDVTQPGSKAGAAIGMDSLALPLPNLKELLALPPVMPSPAPPGDFTVDIEAGA